MPTTRALRILLVEDNPVNQKVAEHVLSRHGHQVVTAANGKAALAILEREAFDLALMDVQMPEMDGLETTARIRAGERDGGRRLPILALTANTLDGDREKCLRAGMDGYLTKPVTSHVLIRAVEQALSNAECGMRNAE
jgi:CheY-like chemotaxis protein